MEVKIVYYHLFILIFQLHRLTCISGEDVPEENSWTVQTNSGLVQGKTVKCFSGKEVYAFYGIPYAEPPINEYRFQVPHPVKPWSETFLATKKPLPCYQFYTSAQVNMSRNEGTLVRRPWSEDCLKLNVWSPKPMPENEPVLVLFHPGGYSVGSSTFPYIDGSTLAAHSRAVIISINYRLGAFGFLNLGIPGAPGNVGLLDQQIALKWIKENVKSFGGQPDIVILVGTAGAGSASVGYHMMSSGSHDLFRTAALISGAPNCAWAFQDRDVSLKLADDFAKSLSCDRDNAEDILECLREVHPEDIVDAHRDPTSIFPTFKPTVDGSFITESPEAALKAGHFALKPTLVWTASHEGSLRLLAMNQDVMSAPEKGISVEGFRKVVKKLLPHFSETEVDVVEAQYLDKCHLEDHLRIRDAAIQVYSDVLVDCCVNQFIEHVAEHGGQVTHTVDELLKDSHPSWIGGAHGSTIQYILGYPLAPEINGYSQSQASISEQFIIWIDSHIRRSAREVDGIFSVYTLDKKPYVHWDAEGPKYLNNYKLEQCNVWNSIFPGLKKAKNHCNV